MAALLVSSCSKSETDSTQTPKDGIIRVNTSNVGEATKAIVVPDADLTGIQFLRKDGVQNLEATVDFTGVTPASANRVGATTAVSFTTAQKYDKENANFAYFLGYHPAADAETSPTSTWNLTDATTGGKRDILITDVWNAGCYTAPVSTGMKFHHALARVEVIAVAAASADAAVVNEVWGDITKVEITDALPTLTLDWAAKTAVASGTAVALAMTKGTTYADDFAPVAIAAAGTTDVIGGTMIGVPTSALTTVNLKVYSVNKPAGAAIQVTNLSEDLAKGKICKITLAFGATDKEISCTTTEIIDWTNGATGSGAVPF